MAESNGKASGDTAMIPPGAQRVSTAVRKRGKRRSTPANYRASIYHSNPNPQEKYLPPKFVALIKSLEEELQMPVWLLIQNGKGRHTSIDDETFKGFQSQKNEIEDGKPVALLIESPGGLPDRAYYIGRYFQRRATPFLTIVPQYAKSAGTLLALAGTQVLMGRDAEIGPLDVQVFDAERERFGSALNTLQSLERLHADALSCFDAMMQLLLLRTGKKVEAILPAVLRHSTEFVQPLVEKIDTLDYTEKSRAMKMAEEYAIRLMMKAHYAKGDAEALARRLVTGYADHGFIIDAEEARDLDIQSDGKKAKGIRLFKATPKMEQIFDSLIEFLDSLTVVGRLTPV